MVPPLSDEVIRIRSREAELIQGAETSLERTFLSDIMELRWEVSSLSKQLSEVKQERDENLVRNLVLASDRDEMKREQSCLSDEERK